MALKSLIVAVVFSTVQNFCYGQYNGLYFTNFDTIPCFNGVSGISILAKREILQSLDSITVNINELKVISFSIAYTSDGGVIGYSSNSNHLTEKMKSTFGWANINGAQFCEFILSNKIGEEFEPTIKTITVRIID